ncbi:conjugative relaxase [Altericroceibacterium spongiae]|uniref:Conjugative relaxase n=1 Tax=Altericroceibacterium spongiae TaxID=2320269 RepID=A0A420E957_9SPHN|nr:MobF family relaxase [Altericroceibacterium spongiae]RKF15996.1 conjugative relaxase [Altericroceibacterium spongiae]
MISMSAVKSSSGAASYFAKDNYYTQKQSSEASLWGGEAAKKLNLSGEVSKADFENILNGILPDGTKVGSENTQRRISDDFTFSMPKSASIMAYVAKDERVLAAHFEAVKAKMKWAEKNFAETRDYSRSRNGEPVKTGNLLYAMFQHDTSRELDPQGHIHVIIANLTQNKDGDWRALRNSALWENNTTLGAAYHAEFRDKLEALGYQTDLTGKHGQFEIAGVPKELIEEFSQRRQQVLDTAKAKGIDPKDRAALEPIVKSTRNPKINLDDREALRKEWADRSASHLAKIEQLKSNAVKQTPQQSITSPGHRGLCCKL